MLQAPCFFVPFPENKRFVGREDVLASLRGAVFDDGSPQTVAVVGLGGIGKTQVVLQMAYYAKTKPNWSVFWLPTLSMASFEDACTQMAEELSLPRTGQEDAKELVRGYLESSASGRWLLIVDNADDSDILLGKEGVRVVYVHLPRNLMKCWSE
jgi:hypothetical protein